MTTTAGQAVPERRYPRLAVAAIAILVGLAASWRLQLQAGTIGLVHDWNVPPDPRQNVALAQQIFDGWYRWVLGEPATYPTEYPFRFALGMLGTWGISGAQITHALVFLIPAAAFLSAWLLAHTWSHSREGAIVAGIFYALNPVMLNKTVSGQTSYLLGYCALPLTLWAYERAVERHFDFLRAVRFGAMIGLAAIQVQIGVMATFLSMLAARLLHPAIPARRRFAVLFTGFCAAAAIHASTIVGIATAGKTLEHQSQFSDDSSRIAWLFDNSIAPPDALRLVGYLTHYDVIAIHQWEAPWNMAMEILLFLIALGYISNPRFRWFAFLTFIPAIFFIGGEKFILKPLIAWLFIHVRAIEMFRELYHVMAIPALIYACGIAFFWKFVHEHRWSKLIRTGICLCVAMVTLPMMTGDANGWMKAFPIEATYGDVLDKQLDGNTRVLWLPMDQPLSLNESGFGTDPMSITNRGSLWDYSLSWPLNVLDKDLRDGNSSVEEELQVLSVGDVVVRRGMDTQAARFTLDPITAEDFFKKKILFHLPHGATYNAADDFTVPSPIPMLSHPQEIAYVPKRLTVYADATTRGYAPIAFETPLSLDTKHAFFYDPHDIPEEAVEMSGLKSFLPTTNIDARSGFATVTSWWWERPEYADVPTATISLGEHKMDLSAPSPMHDAQAVFAWIATPIGGRMRIAVGTRAFLIDTHGRSEWRSSAFALGDIARGTVIHISTLDHTRQVAVRGFTVIDDITYRHAIVKWHQAARTSSSFVALKLAHASLPEPHASSERFTAWNVSYDDGWHIPGAVQHFRSAIGTNIFATHGPTSTPFFAKTAIFHAAYLLGISVLLFGIVGCPITKVMRNFPRPTL